MSYPRLGREKTRVERLQDQTFEALRHELRSTKAKRDNYLRRADRMAKRVEKIEKILLDLSGSSDENR